MAAYNTGVTFALLVLLLLLFGFAYAGWSGAPWVPVRRADVEDLLNDAHLQAGELYIELGCGDGRLLAAAAKRGARAIGYEINPLLWLTARIRTVRYHKLVRVRFANCWRADISRADVVMAFLVPRTMAKLEHKARELPIKARLISYVFKLPTRKPDHRGRHWFIYEIK